MNNLAPIVLFTYNRLWHTKQTIESLVKNELASQSELFIYSDGWKNKDDRSEVLEVREYLKSIKGFKKITIIQRDKNWGLADSIIDGVTDIINRYGKIIVLEDDMITSSYFLKYMNESLRNYKNEEKVWHIGGYVPNIDFNTKEMVFFNRTMYCWGWATWKDRWNLFSRDIEKINDQLNSEKIIFDLNLRDANTGVYKQFIQNKEGKIKTWAVFWYINIFLNSGLCMVPTKSFVHNIGNDNSGINCGATSVYDIELSETYASNKIMVKEDEYTMKKLINFYGGLR